METGPELAGKTIKYTDLQDPYTEATIREQK